MCAAAPLENGVDVDHDVHHADDAVAIQIVGRGAPSQSLIDELFDVAHVDLVVLTDIARRAAFRYVERDRHLRGVRARIQDDIAHIRTQSRPPSRGARKSVFCNTLAVRLN
jgi:hypothetical protein